MKFLKDIDKENIMLIDFIYHRGLKHNNYNDYLDIIYKDLTTGEKILQTIKNPEMEIYFVKEKYRNYDFNKNFMELKNTELHKCQYRYLSNYIAKIAGPTYQKFIERCKESKNFSKINNIHKYNYVFGSDYDIENWYRIQWALNYHNEKAKPITKMFLDIEADTIDIGGFPKDGECPINAVTIIDDITCESYTFLLDNPNNPQIEEFKNNVEEFIKDLHNSFNESYGEFKYNIFMYDSEAQMLIDIFKLINTLKRDFILIWNMRFDIPYIIARLYKLGIDPCDIMCHNDFKIKEIFYKKDIINKVIANRGDFFKISSYSVYLDQMVIYAGLRKSQSELRSNALNYIAQVEIEDEKLDYAEEANIKTLPYINYWKFVKYNIKDVLLQLGIERKTRDIDNIYQRSYANVTSYKKLFKQTVFLKNRAYLEFFKQGLIIGNNVNVEYGITRNIDEEEEKEKFPGALVADPELNTNTGIKVLKAKSKYIYDNVVDMDFKAMYPNIIITFNIAPNCMIGKLLISTKVSDIYKIVNDEEKYDMGTDFVDNLLIGDPANMGIKWFNLPDIEELNSLIKEKFSINNNKKLILTKESCEKYYLEKMIIDI